MQRLADQKPPQPFALTGRVDGHGAQQQAPVPSDKDGPEANRATDDPVGIPRHQAQTRHRIDPIAQTIGAERLAPRRETEVIKRLDLPPIICRFNVEAIHPCPHMAFCSDRFNRRGLQPEGKANVYEPKNGHVLPHTLLNALIAPHPTAWIAPRDTQGHGNLAPYSFFNGAAHAPPRR